MNDEVVDLTDFFAPSEFDDFLHSDESDDEPTTLGGVGSGIKGHTTAHDKAVQEHDAAVLAHEKAVAERKSFSEDEQFEAISDYLTGHFTGINKELRTEKSGEYATTIQKMDSAFLNPEIVEKTAGEDHYRGLNGQAAFDAFNKLKPGDVIGDKTYLSTSTERSSAHLFATHAMVSTSDEQVGSAKGPGVLLTIKTPSGASFINGNADESERIFPRRTQLVVERIQKKGPRMLLVTATMKVEK